MPGKYLRHPGFINSACGSFAKKKKKRKEAWDSRYIYQNELNRACF